MSDNSLETRKLDPGNVAVVTAVALGVVGLAFVAYQLIDILLVLFLRIVVAAAFPPLQVKPAHLGLPKGAALLFIYVLFLAAISLIGLFVGPVLVEQGSAFAAGFPELYANAVAALQASPAPVLRLLGSSLPAFAALTHNVTGLYPAFFTSLLEFTTTTV